MAGSTIASIEQDQKDSAGAVIRTVYAKVVPVYAVYRTSERVMIQYADDPALGSEQRQSVAPISGVRSEINGLIDELRSSPDLRKHARADIVERRLADGLVLLLQGYAEPAAASLAAIKEELAQERASWARLQYVMWASVVALAAIIIATFVQSELYHRIFDVTLSKLEGSLWLAAGAGAVGAFFSIAIAIRRREIKTELIWRDNVADAVLRVLVAVIAAPLLIALMKSGAVTLEIGDAKISDALCQEIVDCKISGAAKDMLLVVIVGFLAGFIERLVPDLLEKTALAAPSAVPPGSTPGRNAVAPNELNPRGMAGATPADIAAAEALAESEDDNVDECLSEIDIGEDEQTEDVELPEATGGVEAPPTKLTED